MNQYPKAISLRIFSYRHILRLRSINKKKHKFGVVIGLKLENPVYSSRYTEFITWEKPELDKIYYKDKNETIAIIYVHDNWQMDGDGVNPFAFLRTKYYFNQKDCEELILSRIGNNRPDILKKHNMDRYDAVLLLYKTRGILAGRDSRWFAWSESDKFEDYHPRGTPESWAKFNEYYSHILKFDDD
jgi:hypothetical protein